MRVATFHAELTRKGPGLLLRDMAKGKDAQIEAVAAVIAHARPDVLLLTKVDVDAGGRTAQALSEALGFPYSLSVMPNSAIFIDGTRAAWAPFSGGGGMVLLSRLPVTLLGTHNDRLWRDLEGAEMPVRADGTPYYSDALRSALPVVTQGLWEVEIAGITFVLFQNRSPVFDGEEDRNGKRSRDQLRLIGQVLDAQTGPFVAMGNTNLDPRAGQGDRAAMAAFLNRDDLQDLRPRSAAGGVNTAFWEKPGAMRVSYILPSTDLAAVHAGILWPESGPLHSAAQQASRHRLVWMDIRP